MDKRLNDNHLLPSIGFGTWRLVGVAAVRAVCSAIESGYRLIDTARSYQNEAAVAEAVRVSGIRDQLVITSKVSGDWFKIPRAGDRVDPVDVVASHAESLADLGLERIDLFLIHWPGRNEAYREAWHSVLELRERGLVRSAGVSNFNPVHLEKIIADTGEVPAVNQIHISPYSQKKTLRALHKELGIATEAFSSLGGESAAVPADLLRDPVLVAIADAHSVTPAQVVIRWLQQEDAVPIVKSGDPERQRQNINLDFSLNRNEISAIDELDRDDDKQSSSGQ